MWRKVKCFVGIHEWSYKWLFGKHWVAIGNQCVHCGVWAKDALRTEIDYTKW